MYVCMFVFTLYFLTHDTTHTDPSYNIPERFFYTYLAALGSRSRFYFIWNLAESVCNAAGLGFEGYDKLGRPKWGLACNVLPLKMELGMNIRTIINSWNISSTFWLRRCMNYTYCNVP